MTLVSNHGHWPHFTAMLSQQTRQDAQGELNCNHFVTVRRYALLGICDSNSVRLSVCLSHSWTVCPHGSTYDHDFFTIWKPHHSSFLGISNQVHPKIRMGSPRARESNEGGVGTNWRFSTNKPPYLRNSARYDKGYYWSLIGNRKRAFDWYQNQRPWLTLKRPWTAIIIE